MIDSFSNNWHVQEISTIEEIESIRPIWEEMLAKELYPVINADVDRYLSVLRALKNESNPMILLLKQNDLNQAMVIGRRESCVIPLRLGYKTFFKPRLCSMTVVYGGVLGQPDDQVSAILIRELMKIVKKEGLDIISFNHLKLDTPFYRQVRSVPGILCRNHFPVIESHWVMSIPDDIELFYNPLSKKHRANLRRCIRKLEKDYKDQVKLITYTKTNEVEDAITASAKVSAKTYQKAMGFGFVDSEHAQSLKRDAAKHGWLKDSLLFIDDEPCAFQLMLNYKGTCFLDQIGFHSGWRDRNVGTVLFLKVLEELCTDPDIKCMDFYYGDASYKRSYADKCWPEAAFTYIFSPRPCPVLINVLFSLNSGCVLVLSFFLAKVKVTAWIKRVWRRSLAKGNAE